jgi:hypothetical protein
LIKLISVLVRFFIINKHGRYIAEKKATAGYNGFTEVEIFSSKLWQLPPDEMMEKVVSCFKENV